VAEEYATVGVFANAAVLAMQLNYDSKPLPNTGKNAGTTKSLFLYAPRRFLILWGRLVEAAEKG